MVRPLKRLRGFADLLSLTQRIYDKNEMSIYAGYTTLYILMAMVPLLSLLLGVVNLLLPSVSVQHIEDALGRLMPNLRELRSMVHNLIVNVNRRTGTLAVSVSAAVTLWSASNGVNAIQLGLCKISGESRSFLRKRLTALFYTLIFIALIPALLVFRVLRGSIEELIVSLSEKLNLSGAASRLLEFMDYSGLITAVVMVVVIVLVYSFLRGERQKIRLQLPGALFTTVFWLAFSDLFELFISRFWQASSLYGSLAAIFLAAMWLKTITVILFYGAALNEALRQRRRARGVA